NYLNGTKEKFAEAIECIALGSPIIACRFVDLGRCNEVVPTCRYFGPDVAMDSRLSIPGNAYGDSRSYRRNRPGFTGLAADKPETDGLRGHRHIDPDDYSYCFSYFQE